ncbi:MAG: hypothetical protein PUP90_28165 [Nostoc sp. S4]|nr:hypothetical protein [Nostoc sp. S4]
MSDWSAIAYGRTYEVDYRFLAIPEDFTPIDCEWAKKYIVATMHYRENLKGYFRQSIFKNKKYCVIGLTCRVSDLINNNDNIQFDIGYDKQNRYIYVFIGHVAKLYQDKKLDYIPDFWGQNFASLRGLTIDIYNQKWRVPEHNLNSKKTLIISYKKRFINNVDNTKLSNSCLDIFKDIDFSQNCIKIPIRAHDQKTSTELWQITAKYILISQYTTSNQDISLCINAENNKYILTETPFIAATVRKMVDYRHQHPANNNDFDNSNYNQRQNSSLGTTSNVINTQNQSIFKKFDLKKINCGRKNFINILFIIQPFFLFILNSFILRLFNLQFLPIIVWISTVICVLGLLRLFLPYYSNPK